MHWKNASAEIMTAGREAQSQSEDPGGDGSVIDSCVGNRAGYLDATVILAHSFLCCGCWVVDILLGVAATTMNQKCLRLVDLRPAINSTGYATCVAFRSAAAAVGSECWSV